MVELDEVVARAYERYMAAGRLGSSGLARSHTPTLAVSAMGGALRRDARH